MAQRYDVTIEFTAADPTKQGANPDHETRVVWRDLAYKDLVEIEKALVAVLQQTTTWGDAVVASKTQG